MDLDTRRSTEDTALPLPLPGLPFESHAYFNSSKTCSTLEVFKPSYIACSLLSLPRCSIIPPYVYLIAWYFVYDLYAMFESYCLRKDLLGVRLLARVWIFTRQKWPFVLHHAAILLGLPIGIVSCRLILKVKLMTVSV